MTRRCYLFDIDGTLANCDHRIHHIEKEPKDWPAFLHPDAVILDKPIPHIVELALILQAATPLVFATGRHTAAKLATHRWLQALDLHGPVYARADGDHRPDEIVKIELLEQMRADGWEPIMAFDDRDKVVAAWRAVGLPCLQVAIGDF